MSNRITRKLDLLQECNDQGLAPKEFMSLFCKRCRNGNCVNSGWAESSWSDRIATQVSRLLTNPAFADPADPNFAPIRDLQFRNVEAPIVLLGGDPWAGPGRQVHLAEPPKETNRYPEVENAIAARAEARNPTPRRAVEASVLSAPTPPTSPVPQQPQKANPRHYTADKGGPSPGREANTAFPSEGMMLDGSPPPPPGVRSSSGEDPWAPTAPAPKKVAVGAKIRMGGEEPKK